MGSFGGFIEGDKALGLGDTIFFLSIEVFMWKDYRGLWIIFLEIVLLL
jgi:hypothetical protein